MTIKKLFIIIVLSYIMLFLATSPLLAQSGLIQSKKGYVNVIPAIKGPPLLKKPPRTTPEELRLMEKALDRTHLRVPVPVDPRFRPGSSTPSNPMVNIKFLSEANTEKAPSTPGTFTFFRNHLLDDSETNNSTNNVNEPSLGVNGRVVFWSGNTYASVSGDGGKTFSYIEPRNNWGPDPNGGVCCDQIVYYERTRGAMFWLLQYNHDGTTGTQRIAVADSQEDILNNTWFLYDFTPADFGFSTGHWLDFPDLSVSDNFLYLTTNVFRTDGPSAGNVVARIPLNEISQGLSLNFDYTTETDMVRATHGATSTMYFGRHVTNMKIRIYRWPESSTTLSWDDVDHDGYEVGPKSAPSPDGSDFAAHPRDRILGAYVADGVIGFMWDAAQDGAFPFPYVFVARFNEGDRSLLSQGQMWSDQFAIVYPSVHPNDRGHLGGVVAYGGGAYYPGAAAWIADDINGGSITPTDLYVFATGDSGPASDRWGDYLTTRHHVSYGNTWAGGGYSLVGGQNGGDVEPRYVWFGRERDTPPEYNSIYVSLYNISGHEEGTLLHPYDTVTEGHFAAVNGDTIFIFNGNYPEAVTFSTSVTLKSLNGTTTIGE